MKCLFCESVLTDDTKPEHILLNALGGRKTSRRLICSSHNEAFGGSIDKAMAEQVAVLRNMLQLDSGTGNDPPVFALVADAPPTRALSFDLAARIAAGAEWRQCLLFLDSRRDAVRRAESARNLCVRAFAWSGELLTPHDAVRAKTHQWPLSRLRPRAAV